LLLLLLTVFSKLLNISSRDARASFSYPLGEVGINLGFCSSILISSS
jgi:hypothetical protein